MHCEGRGVFAQSVLNEYEDDGEGIGSEPKDRRTGLRAPGELTAHFQSHREKEETEDTNERTHGKYGTDVVGFDYMLYMNLT